jgi:deoxyribonuclease-4
LINLASPDDALWNKSIDALVIEWQRAEQLGLDGVVVHPGAFVSSSEAEGLERIVQAIRKTAHLTKPKNSWLLLENTAGQGSCLGWNMQQLGQMIDQTGADLRVGTCIDTCHAHAAGYDLSTEEGLKRLVKEAKQYGVAPSIRAIHVNDSLKAAGSRVDRHEHLGHGTIGSEGMTRFVTHSLFKKLPMYLETEKGQAEDGRDWDVVNLEALRQWTVAVGKR